MTFAHLSVDFLPAQQERLWNDEHREHLTFDNNQKTYFWTWLAIFKGTGDTGAFWLFHLFIFAGPGRSVGLLFQEGCGKQAKF